MYLRSTSVPGAGNNAVVIFVKNLHNARAYNAVSHNGKTHHLYQSFLISRESSRYVFDMGVTPGKNILPAFFYCNQAAYASKKADLSVSGTTQV